VELGYSALTRRERLERIAMAERDRRAGRIEVAIAALGEASEWPARAVLALARLGEREAPQTRQILEEGLDSWVAEIGLAPFAPTTESLIEQPAEWPIDAPIAAPIESRIESPMDVLDRPINHAELELAFAEAQAQTDEMHSANHVAERVLMDEPVGLAELEGEMLPDTAQSSAIEMDAATVEDPAPSELTESQPRVLAILERWLQNLEGSRARGMQ
jgi:hypothetical protein